MNKQQLAAKIWQSANQMRSKIEANEYKDYILGFIFYKYLSDSQISYAKNNYFTDENIKNLTEDDIDVYFGLIGFFVKFGAGYPELESTTFRLSSSNPALPYISLFLFFNLFT